jgi:iron(III) transport system substrate-binding protein
MLKKSIAVLAISTLGLTGCAATEESLTLYSGRKENLVQPLLDQFTEDTGIEVEVRYAGTSETAALILEEGDNTQADVFLGVGGAALGALSRGGAFVEIDQEILDLVPAKFRSVDDDWVGTSGRARIMVYNKENVTQIPSSVMELSGPEWEDRIAIAPSYGSFQAFVTAMRVIEGDEKALQWLSAMSENALIFNKDEEVMEAVESGTADAGLVNHYYFYRRGVEDGFENLISEAGFFTSNDVGNLVNVAGAGMLNDSDQAKAFIEYLLSDAGQQYFSDETMEYPLTSGVQPSEKLIPLDQVPTAELDLNDIDQLDRTLELMREAGLL